MDSILTRCRFDCYVDNNYKSYVYRFLWTQEISENSSLCKILISTNKYITFYRQNFIFYYRIYKKLPKRRKRSIHYIFVYEWWLFLGSVGRYSLFSFIVIGQSFSMWGPWTHWGPASLYQGSHKASLLKIATYVKIM